MKKKRKSRSINPLDRFYKAFIVDDNNCWLWQKGLTKKGYGQISVNGYPHTAHRLSWELHYGAIPSGLFVLHKCDIPKCVNPDHLFVGSQADNMRDCFQKKRGKIPHYKGSANGFAKLNEEQVKEIKRRLKQGEFQTVLGREFGVHHSTIAYIASGRNWGHVVLDE